MINYHVVCNAQCPITKLARIVVVVLFDAGDNADKRFLKDVIAGILVFDNRENMRVDVVFVT
jgi:hypothetical protein